MLPCCCESSDLYTSVAENSGSRCGVSHGCCWVPSAHASGGQPGLGGHSCTGALLGQRGAGWLGLGSLLSACARSQRLPPTPTLAGRLLRRPWEAREAPRLFLPSAHVGFVFTLRVTASCPELQIPPVCPPRLAPRVLQAWWRPAPRPVQGPRGASSGGGPSSGGGASSGCR